MQELQRLLKRIDTMIDAFKTEQFGPEDLDLMIDTMQEARAELVSQATLAGAYRAMYKDAEDKYTRLVSRRQAGNKPRGRTNT
jgi:hypothetical protein